MKSGTVALVVRCVGDHPQLLEIFSDDREIAVIEKALLEGGVDPLQEVFDQRAREAEEDDELGNYIEELLSQPFLKPQIQEHAVRWLKSKIRIEKYQQSELEAARVIASYALQLFQADPKQTDFFLLGTTAKVRVRIFCLKSDSSSLAA